MAKVKINTTAAQRALRKRFEDATRDDRLLKEMGEVAVKNSKAQARLGKDPETLKNYDGFTGKNRKKYIKRRTDIAREAGRGRNFKPGKANLTITGQLIDSITYKISRSKEIILEAAAGSRKPYPGQEKTPTNRELLRWHAEGAGGYPARNALGVSDKTSGTLKNLVVKFLRRTVLKR